MLNKWRVVVVSNSDANSLSEINASKVTKLTYIHRMRIELMLLSWKDSVLATWPTVLICGWEVVRTNSHLPQSPSATGLHYLKRGLCPQKLLFTDMLERAYQYLSFLVFYLRGQGVETTDRCQTCALHPPSFNVHSTRIFRLSFTTSSEYWSSIKVI